MGSKGRAWVGMGSRFFALFLACCLFSAALAAWDPIPKRINPEKVVDKPGFRFYENDFLLPRKPGKYPIRIKPAREALITIRLQSEFKVQCDLIIDGILSSAFGGMSYDAEQVIEGDIEFSLNFSRMGPVKEWYLMREDEDSEEGIPSSHMEVELSYRKEDIRAAEARKEELRATTTRTEL